MFLHLKTKRRKNLYNQLTDEQLISEYRQAMDGMLVTELFDRYTHLVYGICLKYLKDNEQSKDAVMEIFESLFEKLLTHEVTHFKNWLYSVTRNYCLMQIRRSNVFAKIKYKLHDEIQKEISGLADPDIVLEDEQMIKEAVKLLNHKQNQCLHLLYMEDKSYKDISELTGYSLKQIKTYVQNGKRNLKNFMLKYRTQK